MSQENYVCLAVSDGSSMDAYISIPSSGKGPFPGILLFQEAFGVNSHIRSVANRLSALGYVVIAPELFHRAAPSRFEGDYNDFPALMPIFQSLTVEGLENDSRAAYKWLLEHPQVNGDRIGSIGFCMGGRVSFIANMILPLSASVSFYSGGMLPLTGRLLELHAPQLMFWGGLDGHITEDQVEAVVRALKEAKKEYVNVVFSNAGHAFHCDERPSFHPQSAKEAWAMTVAFLENKLK